MTEALDDPLVLADKRSHDTRSLATFYRGVMVDANLEVREKLRAAKQLTEMLGLKDQSGYEPPKEDLEVVLDEDWRKHYENRLINGEILSAKANGTTPTNGNGAAPTNGNGKKSPK